MSYRLIPHHIYYFSDIEICIVWRKIGVWRGAHTSQSQYLSHFIYPSSSSSGRSKTSLHYRLQSLAIRFEAPFLKIVISYYRLL